MKSDFTSDLTPFLAIIGGSQTNMGVSQTLGARGTPKEILTRAPPGSPAEHASSSPPPPVIPRTKGRRGTGEAAIESSYQDDSTQYLRFYIKCQCKVKVRTKVQRYGFRIFRHRLRTVKSSGLKISSNVSKPAHSRGRGRLPPPLRFFVDSENTAARSADKFAIAVQPII